jgi:polyphosphate kinase
MKKSVKKNVILNREISWLFFNHRVLQESANQSVPLLERLRFLGIYSNNLDEFFRVRVAILRKLSEMESRLFPATDKPTEVLKKISKLTSKFQQEFEVIFDDIVEELKKEHLLLLNERMLNEEQISFVYDFFNQKLIDSITPLMVSRTEDFPELADARIYLSIKLSVKDNPKKKEYALIEVPTSDFSRFLVLPSSDGEVNIIMLDDVIRLCLPMIFQSLQYDCYEAYTIKITRDAEIDNDDFGVSLIEKVSKGVKNRRLGNPVRFVYDAAMPDVMLRYILKKLNYKKSDTIISGGRYHNFKDFMSFPSVGNKQLSYVPMPPLKKVQFENSPSVIKTIEQQDMFLYYPYFGFSNYVRLLREAAIDPDVHSIKITLYRVATNSKVTRALINAARNGKHVTAVVEIFARFDEEHNIKWANRLQEAGVNVLFGVEGLKIHSKLTLIKKKNNKAIAAISTGNFHEGNAAVYTDFTLLTSNKKIVAEVEDVFDFIDHPFHIGKFSHLLVSPQEMRKKLNLLISNEITHAKKGHPAFIHAKINHITDHDIILKLYEAAKCGVDIKLVVRGMCSIKPPKEMKNMEIVSIVDRFLEHSRIMIFCNNDVPKYYITSGDWMTRNLDHRIEVAVPIYDESIQQELKNIINFSFKDNIKARIIDGKGENKFKENDENSFRSQYELYEYYKKNNAESL